MIVTGWGGVDPIDTLLLWWLKGDSWDYWRSPHDEKGMSSQHCWREVASNPEDSGGRELFFFFWDAFGRVEPMVVTHHLQKIKVGIPQKKSRYFLDKFSAHVFATWKEDFSQDSTFYAVKYDVLTKTFQVFFVGRNHVVGLLSFSVRKLSKPYVAQTWR